MIEELKERRKERRKNINKELEALYDKSPEVRKAIDLIVERKGLNEEINWCIDYIEAT